MQVGQIYQKFECKDRSDGGIVRNVVRWSIENLLEVTILWPLYLWGCSVFSFPMPEDSHFFPSISLILIKRVKLLIASRGMSTVLVILLHQSSAESLACHWFGWAVQEAARHQTLLVYLHSVTR